MNRKQMSRCDEYCVQLTLYLDGELDNDEKKLIEAHLKDCRACREIFNRERWFLASLQRTAPLYVAPDDLRTRIKSVVDNAPLISASCATRKSRHPILSAFSNFQLLAKSANFATVLTSLLIIVGLWFTVQIINPEQSMTFAAIAVDAHQRHTLGRLPLELTSDSPTEISRWFDGKVSFSLKLPNYQEVSGQDKLYRLEGARLIGFKNDYAAYVAYQMGQHPISLVVTSSAKAEPEGGVKIASKGLIIHYETIAGLKVITWSHRGLTYALVSDLDERGQQSCLVCHHGTKDKDFMGHLDFAGQPGKSR